MAVQTQIQVRRGTASSWTSTNPTLAAGEIGFESDTGKIKVGTGSATWNSLTYIGAANAIQYVYNASAGQTTFSGADANGATLAYTVGAEQVYVNGVLQVRGTDYTATNGTSVVLTTATIASDVVTIVAMGTFTVADTYTQAQANATFPLNSIDKSAGKNKIINGDFGIWQRGTSFSNPGNTGAYTADRYIIQVNAATTSHTVSQQTFTPGTAPVSGYEGQYFYRSLITTPGSCTVLNIQNRIEDVRTFAGQNVTVSFWAKADTTRAVSIDYYQVFGTGGSTTVSGTLLASTNLTTGWVRYSGTVAIPSISGKTIGTGSYLAVVINQTVTAGSTLDIWGVQLEAGSVATAFQTATGTIQGELAACQRYYWRMKSGDTNTVFGSMWGWNSTNATGILYPKVTMRTQPSSVDYANIQLQALPGGTTYAITSFTLDSGLVGYDSIAVLASVSSGLTASLNYRIVGTGSSAYIGLSAEL